MSVESISKSIVRKTSNTQTIANVVKACIGTGMLSLPHAFMEAGWFAGTVGMIVCGFISIYCMHQLLRCYRKVSPNSYENL